MTADILQIINVFVRRRPDNKNTSTSSSKTRKLIIGRVLTVRRKYHFENIVGTRENAGNQHFSFSHNVFYPVKDKILSFEIDLISLQQNL